MRPVKLTMSAFGPYSGTEVIDFSELQDRNLFLVTGPTGSGKTTIFDAISYALFGKASGELRTEDTLRSHFSEAGLLTEVKLTYVLKGITYHVHRIPSQQRPKTRGEGLTDQKPEATLTIEDGDPRTVITGVSKVNQKIEDLMGINAEQFRQIMMIPQGEFRRLLTADSQEREKVLQQLFDTQIYRKIQYELNDRAKALGSDIRGQKVQRDTLTTQIKSGDNEDLLMLIQAEDKAIQAILDRTAESVREDKKTVKTLTKVIETADEAIESIHKEEAKAINNLKNLEQMVSVQKELAEQTLLTDSMTQKGKQIEKAEKAIRLIGLENNLQMRRTELSRKQADIKVIESNVKALTLACKEARTVLDSAESNDSESRRLQFQKALADYQSYVSKVEGLESLVLKVGKLDEQYKGNDSRQKALQQTLKQQTENLSKQTKERDSLKGAGQRLEKAGSRLENITRMHHQLLGLQKQLEVLLSEEARIIKGDVAVAASLKAYNDGAVAYKKAKIAFFTNQAAVLAAELTEDQPCPVCGSLEHPSPAVFTGNPVTEEDLEVLEKHMNQLEQRHRKNESGLAVLKERCNTLRQQYEGEAAGILAEEASAFMDAAGEAQKNNLVERQSAIELQVKEATAAIKSFEKEVQRNELLETAVDKTEKTLETVRKELQQVTDQQMGLLASLTKEKAALEHIEEEVPKDLRQMSVLRKKITEAEKAVAQEAKLLKEAREAHIKADKALTESQTRLEALKKAIIDDGEALSALTIDFDKGIQKAGFDSQEAYTSAKLTEEVLAEMKETRETWQRKFDGLKVTLKGLESKTKGVSEPDMDAIRQSLSDEEAKRKLSTDQLGTVKTRMEDNKAVISKIKTINEKIKDRETAYNVIGRLARVANGQNPAMMSFERYVLAAFLEDILRAANIRLRQMTQGRYVLSRTDELSRKNRQSGLELEVFDNFTGKSRHVKTLSGGEGFKASLSMALGLSDVVQSYAGGVRLDTMFIDEGFGTLDQESLDSAINCLIDLQKSGRLVGIISHVQELKERIDTRLEIISTNKGSESRFFLG